MRIAVATRTSDIIGGVEVYLDGLIPALHLEGHEIALVTERAGTPGVAGIADRARHLGEYLPIDEVGLENTCHTLRMWRPDIVFAHGMANPAHDEQISKTGPVVFFMHGYHGTCISGTKCITLPTMRPCHRTLGVQCLVRYYPQRCGGLSPFTLWQNYVLQMRRLRMLRSRTAVVTHSDHMRRELIRHGVEDRRVHLLPFGVPRIAGAARPRCLVADAPLRLACVARLDAIKGVHLLIEAAALVSERIGRSVHVQIVGDGPERHRLVAQAARVSRRHDVSFDFVGWVARASLESVLSSAHLLAFPSAFAEPFGLVGAEASQFGLPVVAFDHGGTKEWLRHRVNGCVASGTPPSASSLGSAIVACVSSPETYARLQAGALQESARFSLAAHIARLTQVFDRVVREWNPSSCSIG